MSKKLQTKLAEWEQLISQREGVNTNVSAAAVGWHLDHGLKVINSIYRALTKSNPAHYKGGINILRRLIFFIEFFPRGRARAPKAVLPPDIILEKDIRAQLAEAHDNIQKIKSLPENAYFKHPVFGLLNRDQSLQFLALHTEHHLKIMRDILKHQ